MTGKNKAEKVIRFIAIFSAKVNKHQQKRNVLGLLHLLQTAIRIGIKNIFAAKAI